MSDLDPTLHLDSLVADLAERGSALVAYSGGVDSAVVAALAHRALGDRALAVTAAAETLAGAELDHARQVAAEIGIRHEVVTYSELDDPEFVANPSHRCYVCQGMRMGTMVRLAAERGYAVVCDGTNASDPGPDRPGLRAVQESGVYSPPPRPRRGQGGDPGDRPLSGALGVGPAGQRLPLVPHPPRPARHPRQAAGHRGRRGGAGGGAGAGGWGGPGGAGGRRVPSRPRAPRPGGRPRRGGTRRGGSPGGDLERDRASTAI